MNFGALEFDKFQRSATSFLNNNLYLRLSLFFSLVMKTTGSVR